MDLSLDQVMGYPGQGEDLAILERAEHLDNLSEGYELPGMRNRIVGKYSLQAARTRQHSWMLSRKAAGRKRSLFILRLAIALFGGFTLVAPMLIMAWHPTRLTALLTTSLLLFAVAVALAWWMEDAQNKDIIAATAAYAAVLVVFVGAGTSATGA